MELSGKRVLVTGGARRVGAALAAGFARAGAKVTIHYRRSADEAERLVFALPGTGHDTVYGNLADAAETAALFTRIGHGIDILINNASWYARDAADFSMIRQINVDSPVSLMKQFAAQDPAEGVILNILDGAALQRNPAPDAYTASRAELAHLTQEYARFCAPGIRVNGLAPGPVLPPAWLPASRMEKVSASLPLRHPVRLDELVEAALFLCRAESVTGVLLPVDCGLHLN